MCRSASLSLILSFESRVGQEEGVKSPRTLAFRRTAAAVTALILMGTHAPPQESASTRPASPQNDATSTATALEDLQEQVRQLRTLVEEVRTENAASRSEMQQLRQELRSTRELLISSAAMRGELSAAAGEPPQAPRPERQTESAGAGDSAPSAQ